MSDLEKVTEAQIELINTLVAQLAAMQVVMDALVGTLGRSLPPLLPVLQENLFALADVREEELPEEQRRSFRHHIAHVDRMIEAVK